jgi:hypothetical protein
MVTETVRVTRAINPVGGLPLIRKDDVGCPTLSAVSVERVGLSLASLLSHPLWIFKCEGFSAVFFRYYFLSIPAIPQHPNYL